jgi:glycosyltransferase involved in cell wall biosynthesis
MWITLAFGLIAALFALMSGSILFHLRWVRRLPELDTSISSRIRCSIVIAARDEQARLENSIGRLLVQGGIDLEIIVVNDRSTDRTGEILRALSERDSRVHVLTVENLPNGWLGKCHACHLGAQAATGEWILFTDADCWMKPDVVARALSVAASAGADHITLTPGVAPLTISARAWHLAFLMTVADWISGVNRDRPKKYLGMGAFNLVRAAAYHASGGYEALRLTILDDVKLGLLLRRAGYRTRAFIGGDDVECHWGATAGHMIHVMEKNYFAALEYRILPALAVGIGGPVLWAATILAPLSGTISGAVAFLALLSLAIPAAVLARRIGWSCASAIVVVPFIYPVLFYAILNSTVVTLRQGGIRWRDTFYSLETLRRGTIR